MIDRPRSGTVLGLFAAFLLMQCAPRVSLFSDGGDAGPDAVDPLAWPACSPRATRCVNNIFQRCDGDGEFGTPISRDCPGAGLVCDSARGCIACLPGSTRCSLDELSVERCNAQGSAWETAEECDGTMGVACVAAQCRRLCESPTVLGTNIGCEYYAVDLDNAQIGAGESAASQQYAVVLSNPHPTLTARVVIEFNSAPLGLPARPTRVASAAIPPRDLEVFPLPAREVDGSPPGEFNTGTHTALTSNAYRITSTIPVIAYQFNPLENVLVFSNDASLLIPTNSLSGDYAVLSWPQTLASNPAETVLNPGSPLDLRAFLTIVGTQENTTVRIVPRADVVPGGPIAMGHTRGTPIELSLGPFDVLNLETGTHGADFTGSTVIANNPVAVFAGVECADSPAWGDLNDRRCCCDHLETQVFPRSTLGRTYVGVHFVNRTRVVRAAGAMVAEVPNEPEFTRVLATAAGETTVRTTLPVDPTMPEGPQLSFVLQQGESRFLRATRHYELTATAPVYLASFMASQLNTGIPLNFPGGDPSFVPMPPAEQWREEYVFLTPNSYAFDFVSVVAPREAQVTLDGATLPTSDCVAEPSDGCVSSRTRTCPPSTYTVFTCQLSFPLIDNDRPYPMNVRPGRQQDGVHVVRATRPVGVWVSGFDLRVSYGYPAGTQLQPLL
ncbi:MAG: IgGFc-binding protein [Deltaproteobacteria bacterium]|nr:IgGFc-binding protein [Deltaproteobacteria bacterium]